MALTLRTEWLYGSYQADRNYAIKMIEAPLLFQQPNSTQGQVFLKPHFEGVSVAVGYGLDLLVNSTQRINEYLGSIGLSLTANDITLIGEIKQIKNSSVSPAQKNQQIAQKVSEFNLNLGSELNATAILNHMMTSVYEPRLDSIIGTMPQSIERAALVSLVYHNTKNISEGFVRAYNAGDRAEAWYQLKYNQQFLSNPVIRNGIAKRRFYAADLFNLYSPESESSGVSTEEAKSVYRMYTRHAKSIELYEATIAVDTIAAIANRDFAVDFVQSRESWFQPSRVKLTATFGEGVSITGDIFVGENQTTVY